MRNIDHATEDFFQPRAEQASLFGNHVQHMPEAAVELPEGKIAAGLVELGRRRRAAKRSQSEWFRETFGDK